MSKIVPENEVLYHIGLSREMIKNAKYAVLPGDPGRVEMIARQMDENAVHLATNREYTSYLAYVDEIPVLVCSTGMGGPSVGIGIEEFAMIGIQNFIRIGTCGAIQKNIELGELIITSAAVRLEGTSLHYAPQEYPAVSNFSLTQSLVDASEALKVPHYIGVTASSDTFFPGQERYDSYSGYVRRHFQGSMDEWQQLNVLNFEMEAATLLTICSVFKLRAACICSVVANRTKTEVLDKSKYAGSMANCIQIIADAIKADNAK
ncbi:uridine phosphorylase [Lentisphaerota bacterium ZTH]|nr:uridine phosphorylase [Lentisphaerota bacterium]WET05634.1 uridine phosphorylase [Lentisphaerota bacterium ZTH]